jgi:hypothetical protein
MLSPNAVRQPAFLDDLLPQFHRQLPAAVELVGAAQVHVELVHAALLEQRHLSRMISVTSSLFFRYAPLSPRRMIASGHSCLAIFIGIALRTPKARAS